MAEDDDDSILRFNFVELDDREFELHLQHHGVEQPDNFTGPDQLGKRGVVLCGRLVEAAHGLMYADQNRDPPPASSSSSSSSTVSTTTKREEEKVPCTLAIFEWNVHTSRPGVRIKSAQINIAFKSVTADADGAAQAQQHCDPWVENCAPMGAYSLFETERTLEKTRGWQPSVKLGSEAVAGVESAFSYEAKETILRSEHVYVNGYPVAPSPSPEESSSYPHPDRMSAVQWSLYENKGQKSGIPRYFRTAVLLNRSGGGGRGQQRFKARISIDVRASWLEGARDKARGFFGRLNVKDDDLVFNPSLRPKTDRFDGRLDNLGRGGVNLEDEMGFLLFKGQALEKRGMVAART